MKKTTGVQLRNYGLGILLALATAQSHAEEYTKAMSAAIEGLVESVRTCTYLSCENLLEEVEQLKRHPDATPVGLHDLISLELKAREAYAEAMVKRSQTNFVHMIKTKSPEAYQRMTENGKFDLSKRSLELADAAMVGGLAIVQKDMDQGGHRHVLLHNISFIASAVQNAFSHGRREAGDSWFSYLRPYLETVYQSLAPSMKKEGASEAFHDIIGGARRLERVWAAEWRTRAREAASKRQESLAADCNKRAEEAERLAETWTTRIAELK